MMKFNSQEEKAAYELGKKDERNEIIEYIKNWEGSTATLIGHYLWRKFKEKKNNSLKPIVPIPTYLYNSVDIDDTTEEYTSLVDLAKNLKPIDQNTSLHIYEEIYEINGDKYSFSYAISDSTDDNPLIRKYSKINKPQIKH